MRKLIRLIPVAALFLALFACEDEPRNTAPLTDPWLRERTPLTFKLESQIGNPVIVNSWRNDEKGTIAVQIIASNVDLAAVKIDKLTLPQGATASIAEGSTFDFEEENPQFTVTSENGTTRVYTVSYSDFVEPLVGTYRMNVISGILGGGNPSSIAVVGSFAWNITASTVGDKGWNFPTSGTADNDNIISFRLNYVDEVTGFTGGTCVHFWGADGRFQQYTWNSRPEWGDRNGYYRNIPIGQSRWEKRIEKVGDNEVTRVYFFDYVTGEPLIAVDGAPQYCNILQAGNYTYRDDEDVTRSVTIPVAYMAFNRAWPGPYNDVLNDWSDYRWLFWNIRQTFVLVQKTSDDADTNHDAWLEMNFQ